jgi:hypothetical protein
MIHEESEDMSFRVSQLEKKFKGVVKTVDIYKLEKIIEKNLEENMERMINLVQHTEEKLPNGDNVGQGTQDDRNSSHFDQPSFSKHTLGGFNSNAGSNHGWFPRGIQPPKIDMRKFDDKDPITWIFQIEHLFDLHQVPNLEKITIASLYLSPEQFVWYQWLCEQKKDTIISWSIFTK